MKNLGFKNNNFFGCVKVLINSISVSMKSKSFWEKLSGYSMLIYFTSNLDIPIKLYLEKWLNNGFDLAWQLTRTFGQQNYILFFDGKLLPEIEKSFAMDLNAKDIYL